MDGSRLAVDLDGDGALEGRADSREHMNPGEIVPFGGKAWRLARLAPAGCEVRFEPTAGEAPERPALAIGDPAPWFRARTAAGEAFDLRDLKGRTIWIQFWSKEVSGFEYDLETLMQLHEKYARRNVAIVRINLDRPDPEIAGNSPLGGAPWIELASDGGRDDSIGRLFRVWKAPWSVLIDKDGLIRAKNLGFTALDQALERMAEAPRPDPFGDLWSRVWG
ncbi:MAG: Thiol-disulfide oxidoreductase ResA [candidate division BRC1 bacterium ADurb.BinA364]|nr:MAG: Thiol-disulfide oxidoreductase ResA [candidate division BRC1 bacterium ADurb.BinA364]